MPTQGGYKMRAPARRRRESGPEEPLFLRKTYEMICGCKEELGGWGARGDTIVVKDPDRFAKEVIPAYFKHSKFTSFVRQLNFYGFRKVQPSYAPGANPAADWCEFKHENFLRGEPQRLAAIRRAAHYADLPPGCSADGGGCAAAAGGSTLTTTTAGAAAASGEQEVSALRGQVTALRTRMADMDARMGELSALVDRLLSDRAAAAAAADAEAARQAAAEVAAAWSQAEPAAPAAAVAVEPGSPLCPHRRKKARVDVADSAALQLMMPAAEESVGGGDGGAAAAAAGVEGGVEGAEELLSTDGEGGGARGPFEELLAELGMGEGLEFLDFGADAVEDGSSNSGTVLELSSGDSAGAPPAALVPLAPAGAAAQEALVQPQQQPVLQQLEGSVAAASGVPPVARVPTAADVEALAHCLGTLPRGAQSQLAQGLLALLQGQQLPNPEITASPAPVPTPVADAAAVRAAAEAAVATAVAAPEIAAPLASAALGAFLTHFAHRRGLSTPLLLSTAGAQQKDPRAGPAPLHQPVV